MRNGWQAAAGVAALVWALAPAGPARAGAEPPATARPVAQQGTLRLLGADARQLRFVGETDAHEYPVFLTGSEAGSRARLRLSYTNAVAVMSEASRLKVSINGVLLADGAIASPAGSDPQLVDVDVPAGLLEPGYNAVTVAVQQRHGVDCTVPATYELWTQLDPASSGLTFAGVGVPAALDLNELAALRPRPDGSTLLRIVVPKGVDAARIDQLIRVAEVLAIRGRFTHPVVEVADAPGDRAALDVVIGTADELQGWGFDGLVDDAAPSGLKPGAAPGSSVLVLSGSTAGDVEQAFSTLVATPPADATGTDAGLQAVGRVGGKPVVGGSVTTLHDLGVASQEFSGRLFRAGFDVLMPPDFYAADYGKLTLRVDAGYVAGLDRASQLLVRVNDRDAASLPLSDSKGEVFRERPITVPLADLRPGFNHVGIEALTGAPSDRTCDARTTIEGPKRFILLDSSRLELPSVARIAHMPNLAVTAASGYPYSRGSGNLLYVPHPDAATIAAAATVVVRAAVAAGSPLPVVLAIGRAPDPGTSALIVGAVGDVPEAVLNAMDVDGSALREAWDHIEAQTTASTRLEAARHGATAGDAAAPSGHKAAVLFRRWSDEVSVGHWTVDPATLLSDALQRFVGFSGDSLDFWTAAEPRVAPEPGARLLLVQHAAPSANGATWTLLVAPSSTLLQEGAARLTSPSLWNKLDGRVASLGRDDALSIVPTRAGYFIPTVSWQPGNVRLIAAGWLSSHLGAYLGGFVLLCLVLAVATSAVIRRSGVRP